MNIFIIAISVVFGIFLDTQLGVKDPCIFWIIGTIFGFLAGIIGKE